MAIFNDRLKELMKSQGLSQAELSRRSEIPRTTISDYINKSSLPNHDKLKKLALALNVDIEYLNGSSDIEVASDEYMDYLIGELQELNDLVSEISSSSDLLFIKSVVEKNNEYKGYYDNPYKEIIEVITKMEKVDLDDIRAYAKYRLDNPR
ncbi:helix-turn-helix transcriptional regulator [Staphylococcus pseudoxylosus]|uniref:helix-turn-helix domain-containing protein n=1 Tax=Staphylococcus pseudoxylosus TaxID=2282419 RepID=UPI00301A9A6B